MANKKEPKKLCFVIGPLGDPESEMRIHADWLLEEIILPVFSEYPEYEVTRADRISQPGMIDAQIIRRLLDAELVIADLSTLNPNVFYEIGIRHMIQRSIIHIQLADDKIPFDVSLYRAIKFSRLRPSDLRRAREDLKLAIRATLVEGYEVDNPVTRARGQINIEQRATPEQRLIFDQLKDLQERVELIDRRQVSEMVEERAISRGNLEGYYRMTVAFDPKYPDLKRAMSDAERFVIRHFPLEHMSSAGDRITVRLRKNVTEMEKDLVDRLSRMPGVQDITAE